MTEAIFLVIEESSIWRRPCCVVALAYRRPSEAMHLGRSRARVILNFGADFISG